MGAATSSERRELSVYRACCTSHFHTYLYSKILQFSVFSSANTPLDVLLKAALWSSAHLHHLPCFFSPEYRNINNWCAPFDDAITVLYFDHVNAEVGRKRRIKKMDLLDEVTNIFL